MSNLPIPIGVSMRHLHLTAQDCARLFGASAQLTVQKELSQPGQFAANETVDLKGPKGTIAKVRILGPFREQTQVEVSRTDAFALGINPPVRYSGDLKGSTGITLIGPKGTIEISEGVIVAQRHIHMSPSEAKAFGLQSNDRVMVRVSGKDRSSSSRRDTIFEDVLIRVSERFRLDMHIDSDEANAAGLVTGDLGQLIHVRTKQASNVPSPPQKIEPRKDGKKTLVTEADIYRAQREQRTILIDNAVLITPAARNLGYLLGVLRESKAAPARRRWGT